MKIITRRVPIKVRFNQDVMGWIAFVEGREGTNECGETEVEAIGKLIITYANCWPELWPGLEVVRGA